MLEQSNLRQLKQRIAVRSTLSPLSKQDCIAYIRHRVAIAGADVDGIFTKSAIKRIIKKANGTPRILNTLCDNALITGYGYQQRPITGRTVREVIADFEGKRRFPVLRWRFALSMVFFLLIGVFLFYSQKSNILSIGNNKDLYQVTSMKSIENKEIKPDVEKETTEPIKKNFTTITTLERLSNPANSSIYLDARNTVSIKKSDIYDDKTEESLASDNGHTEVAEQLLEVKDDVNKAYRQWLCSTIVGVCKWSYTEYTEIVKLLQEGKADVNVKADINGEEDTAHSLGLLEGHTRNVKLLVEYGTKEY
jgi:hypothetical protein